MDPFLADASIPALEGITLVATAAGFLLAAVAQRHAQQAAHRIAELFWRDVALAGYVWSTATAVLLAGSLTGVEGLRVPAWQTLAVFVGVASLVIVRRRWVREVAGSLRSRADDPSRPDRPRLVSTTWEIGTLAAALGGLAIYGLTVSHSWGHPVHWAITGLGLAFGYAVGLLLATPRFAIKRASPSSRS